ncbi:MULTISPECIES: xylulokinase [unclassified Marinobacterium]|jgi:xylulokinase|uniref:xylulokinase n=1 Tax=unclassified Marinobacterium TaxID=2644139 RepID=UPI001568EE2F|nr:MULTISPECIES: xylulokinase [unclassified Marinobacterium]NRP14765.1 Xylulose kinase [Marinobacterium sp. xm-a-152]NRP52554.1 Xylulose kinase [Marinobacterium sp. xm-v-242]NRP58020.1 Xylulose kinase [Marinobacterium sp. xm-d-510]NRP77135.1 Xylulose kinase [Marinobacterium sp. xm-m-383]NRP98251.1 Xylulose kinase [Marinobacterium sp. xm-a-127]
MYLGLDLGTSGVKALLMDDSQQVVGSETASITVSRPHPGWSEQDPADWIAACEEAITKLKSHHPEELAATRAISFSGQMHGATLLDAEGEVLRPSILWNDTRSYKEAAELDAMPEFRAISGNIVFPGFTAPKLVWVAKNEPEIFNKVAKVLLPKDYIAYWLSGEYISEMSDAAGTSWLDVKNRCWSEELLSLSGMTLDQMPRLVEGSEAAGRLRTELASRWGLSNDVIIGGGAGDNAASAIGMGVIDEGQAFLSLGTSGVLFAATNGFKPLPESAVHAFCHAIPNTWHQMGVILSATDALNWYARLTGKSAIELDAALEAEPKGPASVTFLPYLSGERTPHNDAQVRGMFIGLDHSSDQKLLTQAVMEGVAFAIRDNLEALIAAGSCVNEIIAVGGGSGSTFWLQTLANILNRTLLLPSDGDFGAAYGAARLAMLAHRKASPESLLTQPKIEARIEPDATLLNQYEAAYQRYRSLYPAIKSLNL